MKQVLIRKGSVVVEDVPAPQVTDGNILVRVEYSCISSGTELSGVTSSGTPLWRKAVQKPQKVKKAFEMILNQGAVHTYSVIKGELEGGSPTGYSAAGTVLDVGHGINDILPGDKVACAGAQCAHHAEVISVPRNLSVKLQPELSTKRACTVTLGAIALQGVRRSNPTLGETFVVIGLGVLGQLTVQLLKANGCRAIGTDLDPDRISLAESVGMDAGIFPDERDPEAFVNRFTGGMGADGVIITAASSSNKIVSAAFQMCRKKGRVVLVGDVGLQLKREDFYKKEIDFYISTSYGPGRYDSTYEEKGLDYPLAYVRWTENRNMAEYLHLLSEKSIDIEPLISDVYKLEDASLAYEFIKSQEKKPLLVLLKYPNDSEARVLTDKISNPLAKPVQGDRIRIAVVGAGGFAKAMHLPNLRALKHLYQIQAIVSRTGHNANAVTRQFGARYATTDYKVVLEDPEIDAVLIATRHNLHAAMTLEALKAGKHVLVEKPLALKRNELEDIVAFFNSQKESPILLTGFNRRFSPYAKRVKEIVANRSNPMIINYRMNAGHIPLDHWVHGEEGGGRNIGEACHIYDLFIYLTGARVKEVHALSINPRTDHYSYRDNYVATLFLDEGSVASLTYTALGTSEYPKEEMVIYVEGKVVVLDDYRGLSIYGSRDKVMKSKIMEKGQKQEIVAFADAIKKGGEWPIALWEQSQAMETAFSIDEKLKNEH